MRQKERDAWLKLALIYQCSIIERICWMLFQVRGITMSLELEKTNPSEFKEKVYKYSKQINSHRAAFRGLCFARGMDPDKLTKNLPGSQFAYRAESFSTAGLVEMSLEAVDKFVGGEVDQHLAFELHDWYEERLNAFLGKIDV